MTTSRAFSQHKCAHSPHEHDHAVGSQTEKTAFYPPQMVWEIARALYPQKVHSAPAPAMPRVVPAAASQPLKHVSALAGADTFALAVETDEVDDQMAECLMDLETLVCDAFDIPDSPKHSDRVHAMVTKLLSRAEMLANPKAIEQVKEEGILNRYWYMGPRIRYREYESVKDEAKASKVSVHFGRLMTIASKKFWELAEHLQKMKGRIVYRDCARDENGAAAVYEELGANPTSLQGLNACLAYGSLPGHSCTAADAVKPYVQAFLKSKYKTWIELPPELRPEWWKGKFVRPVVLLVTNLRRMSPKAPWKQTSLSPGPPGF